MLGVLPSIVFPRSAPAGYSTYFFFFFFFEFFSIARPDIAQVRLVLIVDGSRATTDAIFTTAQGHSY